MSNRCTVYLKLIFLKSRHISFLSKTLKVLRYNSIGYTVECKTEKYLEVIKVKVSFFPINKTSQKHQLNICKTKKITRFAFVYF